ncbi:GGDEF domain-containing protein [Parerythrobacter jejuensis]|uniref:diguanylate cyclase n=1 Tax=Parerythrobacter jejuensis TaxID=795812 RepID=A0A845AK01_9SPHN|nr:GGDEF domain-containing protein [Parerythrobacter jejuensis]MXP30590.1 diguanylate cyclase [Parerythrobacter jejuensis]MXP33350.1 diguanylate cyclase [Parerythrobacter jejuensis]
MGYQQSFGSFSLGRLGRRRRHSDMPENASPAPEADTGFGDAARHDLLDQIAAFLLRNHLDITPANLGIAHAVQSGSDLDLAQKIADRQIDGEPITQGWLDEITLKPDPAEAERAAIEKMMDQLEDSITGFAKTTETARSETGACRDEFDQQLSAADPGANGMNPEPFLTISKAMLSTLQRIETSMKHSQAETEKLQTNLAKARSEANCDHLTGLPNRRAFERELYAFHKQALESEEDLFVAICDVDHFKRVNDTFGHDTGDRLLRAIAGILQCFASEDCFVARHGGEEFVILIRAVDQEGAFERLDKARRELEGRKFVDRRQNRPMGKITFSAGLSNVMDTPNPRDALAAADAALYRAKEQGRNQIIAD